MAREPSRFLELLQAETYPLRYMHKFIGRNTPEFRAAVADLGRRFPSAVCEGFRESGGAAYLAFTFIQTADAASDIMEFLEATAALPELKYIL